MDDEVYLKKYLKYKKKYIDLTGGMNQCNCYSSKSMIEVVPVVPVVPDVPVVPVVPVVSDVPVVPDVPDVPEEIITTESTESYIDLRAKIQEILDNEEKNILDTQKNDLQILLKYINKYEMQFFTNSLEQELEIIIEYIIKGCLTIIKSKDDIIFFDWIYNFSIPNEKCNSLDLKQFNHILFFYYEKINLNETETPLSQSDKFKEIKQLTNSCPLILFDRDGNVITSEIVKTIKESERLIMKETIAVMKNKIKNKKFFIFPFDITDFINNSKYNYIVDSKTIEPYISDIEIKSIKRMKQFYIEAILGYL